jgi:hypothetical protein
MAISNSTRPSAGLLVRVAIDSTAGQWNAPCRPDGTFCYVPIPEKRRSANYDHTYDEFAPFTQPFGEFLPSRLKGKTCHLDPDFHHLTYGDAGQRGRRIQERLRDAPNPDNPGREITEDFIVFWAALKSVNTRQLVCAIIGFYRVAYWKRAIDVLHRDCHRNAHTRYDVEDASNEVVVFANPEGSGRLKRFLEIGCASSVNRQQCVHPHLLGAWGGVDDWQRG